MDFNFDKELTKIFKVEELSQILNGRFVFDPICITPQLKPHQIKLVGVVSKSSWRVEYKTVIEFQI